MKYKLLRDLPMLSKGSILEYGCWVGGGLGVDMGETRYTGGGSSHNGIKTFSDIENNFLEHILDNILWIRKLPQSPKEALCLYETNYINKNDFLNMIKMADLNQL